MVSEIRSLENGSIELKVGEKKRIFDQVLATIAPKVLARITPQLDEEIINNYWKFIIVRNPFDRLVSAWKWSSRSRSRGLNIGGNVSFEKFVKSKMVDKDGNFTNAHWSLQITGGEYKGKMMYDYIGRFEDLPESLNPIAKAFGMSNIYRDFPTMNQTTDPKTREKDSYKKHYTDELIEITSKIYKKDLEAFNYEF